MKKSIAATSPYATLALGGLAVALIGFTPTFFLPGVRGQFHAPAIVLVHGAFAFAWILSAVVQTQLVRLRRIRWHRRFGYAAAAIAAALVLTGIPTGYWATRRDLAAGMGDGARGQLVNIFIELAVFGALVAAAIGQRRNREWHKRLLTLATISVLGPAWFRFRHLFPGVPNALVTFSLMADAVLLLVIAHEWSSHRRVHAAYWLFGSLMIAVHLAELFLSQSAPWLAAARILLGE